LLKVVPIFDPRQLPVLSKQCAMYEWQIYLDLVTEKNDLILMMPSHLPVHSGEETQKLAVGSTSECLYRPVSRPLDIKCCFSKPVSVLWPV